MPESAIVIGAGPAGLMAAEVIAAGGIPVDVYDAMPTPARKFLRAGVGGLNLTHAEPQASFFGRYGERREAVAAWLHEFGPQAVRDWAQGLGIDTFVGSSGRVFPVGMKAAPLLRAWLRRLDTLGVHFHPRHRWLGWNDDGCLRFATAQGEIKVGQPSPSFPLPDREGEADGTSLPSRERGIGATAPGVVLALGGGSWARLGADGRWVETLAAREIGITPLRPANCGFDIAWSDVLRERWAGTPVKGMTATAGNETRRGEFVVTRHGVEGGLIYALAARLRDALERDGVATLTLDLAPDRSTERLAAGLARPRGRDSLANHLRRRAGIEGVKAALLREFADPATFAEPPRLAAAIKALPLRLTATRPIDEAISTAGGIRLDELDDGLMLSRLPGVFCAGEMLDWEAPTGGYLLTACLAGGHVAGHGLLRWRRQRDKETP